MIKRIAFLLCVALPSYGLAHHPIISTFERYQYDQASELSLGALLLAELNCTSCHSDDQAGRHSAPKQAPVLSNLGNRVKPDYLRAYLADPHKVKPGTTMPQLFGDGESAAAKQDVESLLHFLMSQRDGDIPQAYADYGSRPRGERLYHQVGCIACHDRKKPGSQSLSTSVPHGDLPLKYTVPTLTEFLMNPLHTRPSGRMPSMNLTRREASDIASYLLPDVPEKAGIAYRYFEGAWDRLPDLEKLEPNATGSVNRISPTPKQRDNRFGLRFEGALTIEQTGDYRFELGSDDGSRLWIDGGLVIDNDGVHGMQFRNSTIRLEQGRHAVLVDFFERDGGEELELYYSGPGIKRRSRVDDAMFGSVVDEPLEDLSFTVDIDLAAKGKLLFQSKGCASCHQLDVEGSLLRATSTAPALESLNLLRGCLANSGDTPRYNLSKPQMAAIRQAISANTGWTDNDRIKQTMLAANCYACHSREGQGGVEEARNTGFVGTQPEMGDEGRIPPSLDGVGAKLTAVWLKNILDLGAKDRPYMLTKMPAFGAGNVGHLAALFEQIDHVERLPKLVLDRQSKKQGHMMVGDKGFSCIKCHTFGRYEATGVQSIDMTIMARRLREDWFRRYIRNPQVYRRGTRMPSAWPAVGKSLLPEILNGDSDKQIQAVWNYLEDGNRARPPAGLVMNTMELIPTDEAIIYRNFIEGVGSRAIGVGYPEGINLAFDANELRLALIWKGSFIDARRHWMGRGQGFQPPAGEQVRTMATGVSVARLSAPDAAWPKASARESDGYKFRGYRLTVDQRPTFIYTLGDVRIEEYYEPVEWELTATLVRKVTAKSAESNVYYRFASDNKITRAADGWYQVGNRYRTKLTVPSKVDVLLRRDGGQDQLIVPIATDLMFTQEFAW